MADTLTTTDQVSAFRAARVCEPGGRSNNEDFCASVQVDDRACWVVADGLGAHKGGEIASRTAAETICESFRANPAVSRDAVAAHIAAAQEAVLKAQQHDPLMADMRTTVVVLVGDSRQVAWGHVGDSRLYRFQTRGLVAQTEDHSVPQSLVKAGELSPDEIRGHPDRNRLLRTLGERGTARPAVTGPEPLCESDAFLLCTDGFWENVRELEMLADLASSVSPEQWLERSVRRIRKHIHEQSDNYSAVAVFYAPAGISGECAAKRPAAPEDARSVAGRREGRRWTGPRAWWRRLDRDASPADGSTRAPTKAEARKPL
jgi:serine/threonine protein phosphatase PrpC